MNYGHRIKFFELSGFLTIYPWTANKEISWTAGYQIQSSNYRIIRYWIIKNPLPSCLKNINAKQHFKQKLII
jgi:hypothetical protein